MSSLNSHSQREELRTEHVLDDDARRIDDDRALGLEHLDCFVHDRVDLGARLGHVGELAPHPDPGAVRALRHRGTSV